MNKSEINFLKDLTIRQNDNFDFIYNLFSDFNKNRSFDEYRLFYKKIHEFIIKNVKILGSTPSNVKYHERFGWLFQKMKILLI